MLAVSRNWRLIAVWGIVAVYSAATFAQPPSKKAPATPEAKKDAKTSETPPAVTPPATTPAATPAAKAAVPPPTTAAPVDPAAAAAPAPAAANPNRPAAAEFQRLFEEWKNVLKDLRKLKVQYQAAAEGDQPKLKEQWDGLV